MATPIQPPLYMRPHVIAALAQMRQEWEELTEGASLVSVNGSVGFLFLDVINCIGLTQEEKSLVLGERLSGELDARLEQSYSLAQVH